MTTELRKNTRHSIAALLRQSIYSRLAGYDDTNDAERLCVDPAMRHDFVDNQVRLQLFALAYNLGNFLRRLALPKSVKQWSLRTLRDKLVKIGAKVVGHSRYVIFQMAEVAVPRVLFLEILDRIRRLRFYDNAYEAGMMCETAENRVEGMEVNGGGVPKS